MRNLKTLSILRRPSNMHHTVHLQLFITYTYLTPFNNDLNIAKIYHLPSIVYTIHVISMCSYEGSTSRNK